mmetsp:Transcript_26229/g.4508  ORF Transcript_26229/g.4508 Transcript_26229/m.4508 type:complete len:104 (+) Transcript_26229:4912-5223(+)
MYHLEYGIYFRVAAAIDTTQGLYYANWSIVETSFDGSTEDAYNPPIKTLIEVFPKSKASFTVESITDIGIGKTSRPIRIYATNSAHTAVNIDIALLDSNITGI